MKRIAAILTSICFLAVSVLDGSFCMLCMLIVCPSEGAAAIEECEPPPCQSCCPSQTSCETAACEMPEVKSFSCPADVCGFAESQSPSSCLIFPGIEATLSTGCGCQIIPQHLDSALAERRLPETDKPNTSAVYLENQITPDSGRLESFHTRPAGIHLTISSTILRC